MVRKPPTRPARTYATARWVAVLRLATLAGAVLVSIWILGMYPALPDVIPTHFDFSGQPDSYGTKSEALWTSGVMLALLCLLTWLSTKPAALNYPIWVTERNAQAVYREGERMMVLTGIAVLMLYADLALSFARIGTGMLNIAGLACLVAVVVLGIVRMARAAKAPEGTGAASG